MRQELEEKLLFDFPLLFTCEYAESVRGFGFECGDGWYQLIRELCEKLYPLIQAKHLEDYGYSYSASQVKEKYGTLRFYMNFSTNEMEEIIQQYEDLSSKTCEFCGSPGSIDYNKAWLTTTCEEHRRK